MSEDDVEDLLAGWDFWARDEQLPPPGDWTTWLFLGGRGAGKTRAGAEWIRTEIETGRAGRVAILGETLGDAREVMVDGPSGLLAQTWLDDRPQFTPTRRLLAWPNGAVARLFSAEDPDSLRGHQFDCAWSDELAKWNHAEETWDMLQLGLRLGARPRQVATTTPRPIALLKMLIAHPTTALTRASTYRNRANLAPAFFQHILSRFEGTRLGRQEIEGDLLDDNPNALWTWDLLERARCRKAPALMRVVVAVDPPATAGEESSACGIVVAGRSEDGRAYVLADRTAQGLSPLAWARIVVSTYHDYAADRVIAEVNQGGDLVTTMLRQVDATLPVTQVRATRGKHTRAEPVAALYEQGRVRHVGALAKLEEALCAFVPGTDDLGPGRQDRIDALVWALSHLMLRGPAPEPRLRRL